MLLVALLCASATACGLATGEPSPQPVHGEADGGSDVATAGTTTAATTTAEPAAPDTAPVPPAPAAVATPMFRSTVSVVTPELADRMTPTSWREGCPVPLADLRYVTVSHVTFDGTVATGELVVHADVADGVVGVFATLFAERYPVRSMRLVDDFGGDDTASMDADNTSAFNCRAITGGTAWSEHAYGRAIDLNPVENPYVLGRHVAPDAGRDFADRPDLPGVIHPGDVVVAAFAAAGWQWGGSWDSPVDYQHFSVSGR